MVRSEAAARILAVGIGLKVDLFRIAIGLMTGWSPQHDCRDAAKVGRVHHQVVGGDNSIEALHHGDQLPESGQAQQAVCAPDVTIMQTGGLNRLDVRAGVLFDKRLSLRISSAPYGGTRGVVYDQRAC